MVKVRRGLVACGSALAVWRYSKARQEDFMERVGPSTSSQSLGRSGQFPAWPEIGGEDAAEYLEGATMARGASVLHSTGGGEGGIRTPGAGLAHTRFPSVHLKPLGHPSIKERTCWSVLLWTPSKIWGSCLGETVSHYVTYWPFDFLAFARSLRAISGVAGNCGKRAHRPGWGDCHPLGINSWGKLQGQ